jgi:hypothetical protein
MFFRGGWPRFAEDYDGSCCSTITVAHRSLTWRSSMGRSARRSMKLKFIFIKCFSFDVISMQCNSFVFSVMAINTCYEQYFCLLVNEKTKGTASVPRYYFEHLCTISSCLVGRFLCSVLSNSLCR